jgi:transposase
VIIMAFIAGMPRSQTFLLPESVDDYVGYDSLVRAVEGFCRVLPFGALGFTHAVPRVTGRPPYDSADLLGLYIWGFLNGMTSSRRLEKAAQVNLEVIWLLRRLMPDFKTISDFRKDNVEAITRVFKEFTQWLRSEGLTDGTLVAIDGSKFRASNNKDRNFTKKKLADRERRVEEKIERYLAELESNDAADEGETPKISAEELREKIERLKHRKEELKALAAEMKVSGESQISQTDPDSRSMKTKNGTDVCYNAQIAVDSKHKLIVAQTVTNEVNDMLQLASMALQTKQVLQVEQLDVVADAGYANSVDVARCEEAGITAYVSPLTPSDNSRRGLFPKSAFAYEPTTDTYRCPNGETLRYSSKWKDGRERTIRYYLTPACRECPLKKQCTVGERRRIGRRTDEPVLQAAAKRLRTRPELRVTRSAMVEHPFGTIKMYINHGRFLLRGLVKVGAEFSLAALAYDFKRVATIMGTTRMISALAYSR